MCVLLPPISYETFSRARFITFDGVRGLADLPEALGLGVYATHLQPHLERHWQPWARARAHPRGLPWLPRPSSPRTPRHGSRAELTPERPAMASGRDPTWLAMAAGPSSLARAATWQPGHSSCARPAMATCWGPELQFSTLLCYSEPPWMELGGRSRLRQEINRPAIIFFLICP
jgi:hypothetical protein